MFRLVSLNLNGIRSAASKGFFEWAQTLGADCIGVQEVRAQHAQVAGRHDRLGDLSGHFHLAERPGYAGVGLYTRREPTDVSTGFGDDEFDSEGRFLESRYDTPTRKFSVISGYFPSGSSGEHRQAAKFRFLQRLYPHLMALKSRREFVLVGDINIAHQEIDLRNWRSNQKNSGFLPEERAWMTRLLSDGGLVDVFRTLNPSPTSTPGGATAARPGRTTSAGAWTTTWPHPASRSSRGASTSICSSASPITPR